MLVVVWETESPSVSVLESDTKPREDRQVRTETILKEVKASYCFQCNFDWNQGIFVPETMKSLTTMLSRRALIKIQVWRLNN